MERERNPFHDDYDSGYVHYPPAHYVTDEHSWDSRQSREHDPFADPSDIELSKSATWQHDLRTRLVAGGMSDAESLVPRAPPPPPLPPLPLPPPPPPPHDLPADERTVLQRFLFSIPWFIYTVLLIQVAVFIAELARMASLTGLPIQTKPSFNPMIGPLTYVQVNMGLRFALCMQTIAGITNDTSIDFPCPNLTTTATEVCGLRELCGFSGQGLGSASLLDPHQWWRLITPMFLHAGILHIGFNLVLQLTMGVEVERSIGIARTAFIYTAAGISGFLFGANFAGNGVLLTGALGALFGLITVNLLMFVYAGREGRNHYNTTHYRLFIVIMVAEIIVLLFLGLLPGLDNFAHVGGAIQGLLWGVILLKDPLWVYSPEYLARHRYAVVSRRRRRKAHGRRKIRQGTWIEQVRERLTPDFEKRQRQRFYIWCGFRVLCFGLLLAWFAGLGNNFAKNGGGHCKWCKYLNCLPINGWCEQGTISVN